MDVNNIYEVAQSFTTDPSLSESQALVKLQMFLNRVIAGMKCGVVRNRAECAWKGGKSNDKCFLSLPSWLRSMCVITQLKIQFRDDNTYEWFTDIMTLLDFAGRESYISNGNYYRGVPPSPEAFTMMVKTIAINMGITSEVKFSVPSIEEWELKDSLLHQTQQIEDINAGL